MMRRVVVPRCHRFSSATQAVANFPAWVKRQTSVVQVIKYSNEKASYKNKDAFTFHGLKKTLVAATVVAMTVDQLDGDATYCEQRTSPNAKKAEDLYLDLSFDRRKLLEILRKDYEANKSDEGILWRLARAAYDVAGLPATSKEENKALTYESYEYIKEALAITDQDFAVRKWYGIILSAIGDFEGTKVSIANSYTIRDHWLAATELNPADATSRHLLGRWAYSIANISWVERKVASAIFGTPPTATYEEALNHFKQAESLSPGFWKKNNVMIAQCYLKLKNNEQAKLWVQKALGLPTVTDEDQQAHKEAEALLGSL